MDLREARLEDAEGIRRVARESFRTSYDAVLDEEAVDRVVEAEFGDDRLAALREDPDATLLVVADGDIGGLAVGRLVGGDPLVGAVRWLHVAPGERGNEVGVRLLGDLVQDFENNDAAIVRGHVVEGNETGGGFYETYGFERRGTESIEIAGDSYEETAYEHHLDDEVGGEIVRSVTGPDGDERFVDYGAGDSGTEAPFYPVFSDESLADRYGWRCSNCGSMETTMDADGRVSCGNCDNVRTATRWDGAYL